MAQWHKIAALSEVPPGTAIERAAAGLIIAIFNVEGTLFALDGICPHAGGPLGDGSLRGAVVTCPWHGWQFNVATGRHCLNERISQTVFSVRLEGDAVWVAIPDSAPDC